MEESYQIKPEEVMRKVGEIQALASDYETEYKAMYNGIETAEPVANGNEDMKEFYIQTKEFEENFIDMKQMVDQFAITIKNSVDLFVKKQEEIKRLAKDLGRKEA